MYETHHIKKRIRQRGITNEMIEITLKYGEQQGDKIRLGSRHIKRLLPNHQDIKPQLLKILDKGGLVVVVSGVVLITAYIWN